MWRVSSQRTVSAAASSSSTRNVTSSRFPIGVAQTASGTRHRTPSSASNATSAAPISPASSPSAACTIRSVSSAGVDRLAPRGDAGGLEYEIACRRPEATTDDHDVGVEDIGERSDRDPSSAADLGERRDRLASPPRARVDESGRIGARARRARRRHDPPPAPTQPPRGGRGHDSAPGTAALRRRRRCARARPSRGRGDRRSRGLHRRPCRA